MHDHANLERQGMMESECHMVFEGEIFFVRNRYKPSSNCNPTIILHNQYLVCKFPMILSESYHLSQNSKKW